MGVNKVNLNGETLVDLTGDTVTEKSLLQGATAHNMAGEQITGEATIPTKVSELENDAGYLKAPERLVAGDLKVKGGYFPLLNLVRNEYGEMATIQLTSGTAEQKGILIEGRVANEDSTYSEFQIRDRINQTVLLSLSTNVSKIYDKKSDSRQEIATKKDVEDSKVSLTNNLLSIVPGVSALDAAVGPVIENKGSQISVYKGEDGMLHFRDWNGADTVLNFSVGSKADLLWTNPSIALTNSTEILCDYTKYNKIIVLSCVSIYDMSKGITLCDVGKSDQYVMPPFSSPGTSSGFARKIVFGENLITITKGSGGNSAVYTIPMKLWGINIDTDFYSYP